MFGREPAMRLYSEQRYPELAVDRDEETIPKPDSLLRGPMAPLERITDNRQGDVNDAGTPRPLLTLAEFFAGNDVTGSIGCNLTPMPEPAEFYDLFKRIAARPNVADVRVQVTMFDAPEWPFSDTVWIISQRRSRRGDRVV